MISVSIVEDDAKTRSSLEAIFAGTPGFRCAGAYTTAEEALITVPRGPTHVFIVDIGLAQGKMDGIQFVEKLRDLHPEVGVLMLTAYDSVERVFQALRVGAHGYLLKTAFPAEIVEAVQILAQGGAPMTPSIARKVVQHFHVRSRDRHPSDSFGLSEREHDILDLLCKGRANKDIAKDLGIAPHTVNTHLKNIYRKLHVSSRTEAVARVLNPWSKTPEKK